MGKTIVGLLVVACIIHLLPVSGILGAERLSVLYGVSFSEPNIEILMRHRAILFGLLGLFLIYAAFQPSLRAMAIVAGLVSTVSFIAIAWSSGGYNAAIGKVVIADIVAVAALIIAGVIHIFGRRWSGN